MGNLRPFVSLGILVMIEGTIDRDDYPESLIDSDGGLSIEQQIRAAYIMGQIRWNFHIEFTQELKARKLNARNMSKFDDEEARSFIKLLNSYAKRLYTANIKID